MPRQNFFLLRNTEKAVAPDEPEVIRLCLQGDRQAFERIVDKYRDSVYWTAYRLVLDYEDARDVSQQSFIKIWRSLAEYDPKRSFSGWVSRITANCAIDWLRSRKEAAPLEDYPARRLTIEKDLDVRKIFLRIAPLLSQRQRMVLVLREVEEMEIPEIAQMMECTESTVRNLLSQAKEAFRKRIKEFFPEYGM